MSRSADPRAAARRSLLGALRRDCRGVTAVEFAFAFPVLAMLVFGTIEFGRVLAVRNEMSHALSRAVRIVHLDAATTETQVVALLEEFLDDDTDLAVSITEVAGTSFMQIAVEFPVQTSLPFASLSEVNLRVATLAPMVSATQ